MSQNWKDIGRFSNSNTYKNVNFIKIGKNNIGKLRYFHNENKNNTRGSLFDISGVNEIIGIGTNKPFSRLSLGDISGSGSFDINYPGQLSAIALHEKYDGKEFSGVVFNNNISSFNSDNKKNAVQFIAIDNKDFSMNDVNSGRLYLSEENITTIGGIPRKGPEYNQKYPELTKGVNIGNDSNIPGDGQTKIVLDVRGSIRTDGYLNFYSKFIYPSRTNTSNISWDSSYNITQTITASGIKRTIPSDYYTITDSDVSFNAWALSEQIIDYDPSSNQSIIWKNNVNFIDSNKTKDKYGGIFVGIIDASNTNIINNPHKIAFQYMNHALFDYGTLGVWEYLGKKEGSSGNPWPNASTGTAWLSDVPLLVSDEEKPIDKKDKLEIRIIGETQTVEYYSHIWNDVTGYNISLVYTSNKKLQETDYPFRIAAVIGLTNYGRKPATGLVVDVKTADGTGSSTLESITVTDPGSGYGVGGIITFVKVGDGTNPGDYNSFEYTLVAGDFENDGTIKIGTLSGLSNTIFNGGNATGATTTGVTPTGGSEPITNLPLLLKDQTEVTESLNNFFEDVAISTINYTKTTIKPILLNSDPSELFWENFNNINNIPIGSIWYQPKNKYRPEGLYYKSSNNGINRCVNTINDGPSTIIDGSALFKSNFTTLPEYIIQKSTNVDLTTMQRSAGSVPVTFSYPSLNIPDNANKLKNFAQHYFKNTLTLREGNLSVCGITNSTRRVKYSNDINNNNTGNPLLPPEWRDICNNFGQIWSERQFLIGPEKANGNWAVIDSYLAEKAPALLSTNLGKHIINPFKPIATNSIILGNWNPPAVVDILMTESEAREIAISLGLKLGTDAFPFNAHPTSQTKGLFAYDWENENYGGSAFWGGGGDVNQQHDITNPDEYRPFLKTTHNYISDNDKILDSIGKDYDCTHSIIIGDISSSNINSPFSLISNLGNSTVEIGAHQIRSVPGLNINFGTDNNSNFSPFTLMIGNSNDINNKNNVWSGGHEKLVNGVETHKKAIDKGGGNIILGKNNQLRNTINWIPQNDADGVLGPDYYKGLKLFNSNFVSGNSNKVYLTEYSFIDGYNNHSVGKSNTIFGKDNVVGSTINNDDDLSGNECHHNFVFGVSNKLTTSEVSEWDENSNVAPQNIIIMGKNNKVDLSYNTDINRSYIILGSDVSNNLTDLSNVRFAFGTKEKTIIDDEDNGIVFSIDVSGNVDMSGSIIIGGKMIQGLGYLANNFSDVDISGDVLDISGSSEKHTIEWDNNYEIWNNRDVRIDPSYSHLDYIDLSFVDVASLSFLVPDTSYNLFFDIDNGYKYHINSEKFIIKKNNDISGNDASFNSLFVNKDISASHWYFKENADISGNDASFNSLFLTKDVSASHWYFKENADISGNDASFNSVFVSKDISASHWYFKENADISGNDASFNSLFVNKDISASHWYIREDGDISGNDASFNSLFINKDISASHWYFKENADISGNDTSFNSLFLTKDVSASHWYIREDGDISGNDASFNSLFVNKDISSNHWYIREDGDVSGNDASFNKMVVIDNIIPATNNITIGSSDNPINSLYVSQSSIFMVKDGVATHKIEVKNGEIEFNKVKTSLNSNNEIITETEKDAVTLERFLDRIIDISCNDFEIYGDLSGSDIKILSGLQIPSGDNVILKNITISTDISNNVDISGSQGAKLEIKSNTFDNSWNIVTSGSFNSSNEKIYNFTSHTFTACDLSGSTGPSLSQCRESYGGSLNDGNWWNDTTNNYLNMDETNRPGIQKWTVPISGTYRIKAYGAGRDSGDEGGSSSSDPQVQQGRGGIIEAEFELLKGEVIEILCGQKPRHLHTATFNAVGSMGYADVNSSGSGGTFVVKQPYLSNDDISDVLIVAGGGGGKYTNIPADFADNEYPAELHGGMNGADGGTGNTSSVHNNTYTESDASNNGTGGDGGGGQPNTGAFDQSFGGSGAGIIGNGVKGENSGNYDESGSLIWGRAAQSFKNGGKGGEMYNRAHSGASPTLRWEGGFGGGGSNCIPAFKGSGGGGGYSGGGGGETYGGGGGGSIANGSNINSWSGLSDGHVGEGKVEIEFLPSATPALEILEKNNTNDTVSQFIIDASNNVGVNTNILDASLCVAGDISSNNLLTEKLRIGGDVFNNTSSEVIINGDISCNGSMQISNISLNKTLNNDVAVDVSGALICDIIEPLPDIEGGANSFAGIPEVGPLFLRGNYLVNTGVAINTTTSSDSKLIVDGDVFVNGTITQNTSDLRIKKNIFDVNKSKALEIVKNIPNKYYNYISKNIGTECGFIAQDVKKHFPMAVTVRKNILIPSEYREINTNFTQVWFNESENAIISNRIYNENGQEITKRKYKIVIEDLSNNSMDSKYRFYLDKHLNGYVELKPTETPKTFLFDSELNYLFVFGKYIDDFNALDKKQIFALHHGAIQEIENRERKNSKEIELLEKENINLRKELEILKNLASKVNKQIRNL